MAASVCQNQDFSGGGMHGNKHMCFWCRANLLDLRRLTSRLIHSLSHDDLRVRGTSQGQPPAQFPCSCSASIALLSDLAGPGKTTTRNSCLNCTRGGTGRCCRPSALITMAPSKPPCLDHHARSAWESRKALQRDNNEKLGNNQNAALGATIESVLPHRTLIQSLSLPGWEGLGLGNQQTVRPVCIPGPSNIRSGHQSF